MNKQRKAQAKPITRHTKVQPVVVKHVLTQNFLQKPEIYQNRPDKQVSVLSQ